MFVQIGATRSGGGFGPNPISYSEIEAFSRATGWALDPWEVDAIRALDDAFLATPSERPSHE